METKHQNAHVQHCIDNCVACHRICTEMIPHCLSKGGEHSAPDHIRLLLDCAQICQVSADFMLRGSGLHSRTCEVCAEVCRLCAKDCERLAAEDPMMKECAEFCRRCADSCAQMAKTSSAA